MPEEGGRTQRALARANSPAYSAAMATTSVEIDSALLERLRARHPGKDDRELIEDVAKIHLGIAASRETQQLNALSGEDAVELGVRAVHEARRSAS